MRGSGSAAEMMPVGAVAADRGAAPSVTQSRCPGSPQPRVPGRPLLLTASKPEGSWDRNDLSKAITLNQLFLTHLQVSASLWERALPRASAGAQEPHLLPGFPPDTGLSPVPRALRRPGKSVGSARVTRHRARTGNVPLCVALWRQQSDTDEA